MISKTPQMARSSLRWIPKTLTQAEKRFMSFQCQSRGFSVWTSSGIIPRRIGSPLIRNEQWTRQWSASTASRAASDKDKLSETWYMPPPSSHVEEKAAEDISKPASSPPLEQSEKPSDSIAMPPSPPPSTSPEQTERIPNGSTESPTASSSPAEEASSLAAAEQEAKSTEPDSTPSLAASDSKSSTAQPLPSDTERARWGLSKKTQKHMDDFLAKAAIFSQQLNNYTGTDYSGIEALRREISDQEKIVKAKHAAIAVMKEAYQQAYAAQAASQKEVVGLLERKHSWSAADLERYMSLIRSEHLNEQAVQRAKDELASAERSLEDARSTLERKERKQYHEEQIWSDTIRRNSTWVTFGLMGLNILLLLSNLAVIEPWRRKRLVKEVRAALNENALATSATINAASGVSPARNMVEEQIDKAVEPISATVEEVENEVAEVVPEAVQEAVQAIDDGESAGTAALATGQVLPDEAVDIVPEELLPETLLPEEVPDETSAAVFEEPARVNEPQTWQERVEETWEYCKRAVQDMFSDRQVTVKKVDLTTVALESAAAGVAVMGILVLLFNPR